MWYAGLLCAIIYKQWVLNNGSLVNFINNNICIIKIIILIPINFYKRVLYF